MAFTRGFRGRHVDEATRTRLPPGQYLERGFPVLSAGPTPRTPLSQWSFDVTGVGVAQRAWSWDEFISLPQETVTRDIHCVTKWSKFDTVWQGVSVDTLLGEVAEPGRFVIARSDGGYTTDLGLDDITGGKAWVVHTFNGQPLAPEHGGPARLLVPHLYFWKSAKWVRGLRVTETDERGFWESLGYHHRGDPWLEQRYSGD
ncbi:MAG TPA: sulfite oxidase-like oxidoreductase [Actinomycetota bacterium]|nr:sulfite oxidase-like oxidoreductase [Actinomycetota bacterium]